MIFSKPRLSTTDAGLACHTFLQTSLQQLPGLAKHAINDLMNNNAKTGGDLFDEDEVQQTRWTVENINSDPSLDRLRYELALLASASIHIAVHSVVRDQEKFKSIVDAYYQHLGNSEDTNFMLPVDLKSRYTSYFDNFKQKDRSLIGTTFSMFYHDGKVVIEPGELQRICIGTGVFALVFELTATFLKKHKIIA